MNMKMQKLWNYGILKGNPWNHEFKNKDVKNPWAVWNLRGRHIWSTVSMLIFKKFKVVYAYCSNLNLKTDFLFSGVWNSELEIQIVTGLWKVNLNAHERINTKRHSQEILNMKINFLRNLEDETENALTSWIWNQNFCKTVNL